MKHIIRFRWPIAIAWIVIAVSLFVFGPSLPDLVQEKGQISVPPEYTSQQAQQLMEQITGDENKDNTGVVLVFHQDKGLNAADKEKIAHAIDTLKADKTKLGLSDILAFTDDENIAEQTVADDGKTIMVPFQVSLKNQDITHAKQHISAAIDDIGIDHHLTGQQIIEQDIVDNSQDGLQKTELITVALILVILFLVFKSFVAPFVPLLTVGISYLAAQGVVAILADTMNFPLSTFTQIFMVAIMFGIGTDYCILLISRFKEELTRSASTSDAVITTYRSGGKTILFAGLAVLIGFSTIGLSTFTLYQSAVAVAIGVGVVLIALTTLVPFFLTILGKKLFWPFDKNTSHKESKIWGAAGQFAWKRPVIALAIVAVIVLPFTLSYDGDKSYDSLAEIGDSYGSVQAFDWIADSFGPGQSMPTTVVMKTDKPMDSVEDFQAIADMTGTLAQIDGVKQIRSATRPTGEIIDDFLANQQTGKLADGINQSTDGLDKIQKGLADGAKQLKQSKPQLKDAQSGVKQLMKGTNDAKEGIGNVQKALTKIQDGIQSGSSGAKEIKGNLQTIKDNLDQTIAGNKQLLNGYKQISKGLSGFGNESMDTKQLNQLTKTLKGAKKNIATAEKKAMKQNIDLDGPALQALLKPYETAKAQIDGSIDGINTLQKKLDGLKDAGKTLQTKVVKPLNQLNSQFDKTIHGQEKLSKGIGKLLGGVSKLQSGLDQAADGQGQIVNKMPSLQQGLAKIYGGQKKLKTAFSDMQNQLSSLSDGLTDSANGLGKVNDGLLTVRDVLNDFDADATKPVVIIPKQALDNDEFMTGTKAYLSKDKTIVKFDVILSDSPYSTEAIQMIDKIKDTVNDAKKDTIFASSTPEIGGVSSTNNDLQHISDDDYSRTVVLMIIGIFIVLVILLRSLIIPIYLIGSLILTYLTSMGVTELIFTKLLHFDGLTWAIPFFAFVMLMALGIDYSIFLMDRFNEQNTLDMKGALLSAMRKMGTVIISAAIILGGTFGAMLPSGVLSLLEIATAVLTGLFLYAFVMLPLFVPIMVRIFGKISWWPFHHFKDK